MPTFKVLGRFERDTIPTVVPPDFRQIVHIVTKPGTYTVILFAHNREKGGVTISSKVRHAFEKVSPEDRVLAVGDDFTVEATRLLEERSAAIARIGEFGWTDEGYIRLHEPAT